MAEDAIHIYRLPDPVLLNILKYLSITDLLKRVSLVSKRCHALAVDPSLPAYKKVRVDCGQAIAPVHKPVFRLLRSLELNLSRASLAATYAVSHCHFLEELIIRGYNRYNHGEVVLGEELWLAISGKQVPLRTQLEGEREAKTESLLASISGRLQNFYCDIFQTEPNEMITHYHLLISYEMRNLKILDLDHIVVPSRNIILGLGRMVRGKPNLIEIRLTLNLAKNYWGLLLDFFSGLPGLLENPCSLERVRICLSSDLGFQNLIREVDLPPLGRPKTVSSKHLEFRQFNSWEHNVCWRRG